MKSLKDNEKGNANVILLSLMVIVVGFGLLTIGSYLYFAIATSANAGTLTVSAARASTGSFNFNGNNVSNGELVNITDPNNGSAVYRFEFNTTAGSTPIVCQTTGCIPVNLSRDSSGATFNTSTRAAINLTVAINGNSSTALLLTASSATLNRTTLADNTAGVAGNLVALSTNAAAVAASSNTLLGGADAVTGQATQNSINNYVTIVFPIMGLALMILGFGTIFYTLRGSFGMGGGRTS